MNELNPEIGAELEISVGSRKLIFHRINLAFLSHSISNVFAQKNNKTISETIEHPRYRRLDSLIRTRYPNSLNQRLGEFLLNLKQSNDPVYKQFLNLYGDLVYCKFQIAAGQQSEKKGIYCFCVSGKIVYVGRSIDPFSKRFDQGYGSIHPKNCYLDGQSTNCRVNALIASEKTNLSCYVCPMTDNEDIDLSERELIYKVKPAWNKSMK